MFYVKQKKIFFLNDFQYDDPDWIYFSIIYIKIIMESFDFIVLKQFLEKKIQIKLYTVILELYH